MDTSTPTGIYGSSGPFSSEETPLSFGASRSDQDTEFVARTSGNESIAAFDSSATRGVADSAHESGDHLIQARLGVGSALFAALKAKDAATATHSYRVAIYCSSWAKSQNQPPAGRDSLEIASLLHDVGKIGVPDSVLLKPAALWHEEAIVMERHRSVGLGILQSCCASPAVVDIVRHAADWYDGTRGDSGLIGELLPLGSRMLAIANAFDAMTTDQVYRRALPRERAVAELFRCAGTQFDPVLVHEFAELNAWDVDKLADEVAHDWLRDLAQTEVNARWHLQTPEHGSAGDTDAVFRQALPEQITDAVIFVDKHLRIVHWNRGAERLTGIAGESMRGRRWLPSAIALRDERRRTIADDECPVAHAIETGQPWIRRMHIKGRGRRRLGVDAHVTPVALPDGRIEGATLVMHDVSPEISLEARCQSLHELATKDPLTQVANRAEFDRVLALFVVVHLEQQRPCSMIMGDIDYFKRINDTYGHQAGDEVLKFVAHMLRNSCRPGDLVSRYGGEEFVLLCTDCDNTAATRRAEEIRRKISMQSHAVIDHESITISFGVTEIQPGDTPDTMLHRADRALYQAKRQGRNGVVQLGTGLLSEAEVGAACTTLQPVEAAPHGIASIAQQASDPDVLAVADLVAWTPLAIGLQRLQGFTADHNAEVILAAENRARLRLIDAESKQQAHGHHQPHELWIDLDFNEETPSGAASESSVASVARTLVRIVVRTGESTPHDAHALKTARQLIDSLKAYLVAEETIAAGAHASIANEHSPIERGA
jgi:diguanylate cyclase (GGDEF)-like protein/PAS domain S-box-containing protein